jgi:hypothetical protein
LLSTGPGVAAWLCRGLPRTGTTLIELRCSDQAVIYLQQALRLQTKDPSARHSLARALADLGRFEEALAAFQEALQLAPDAAEIHNDLGSALRAFQRLPEALASYDIAIWLKPQGYSAHWNRSLTLLQSGDFTRGWVEYEWRWQKPQKPRRNFTQPTWDGSPLEGKTILLHFEQGIGDTLQFARYAPLVKERGGKVLIEAPAYLRRLLSRCEGIDSVVAEEEESPSFDVQFPLMSLPKLFGTTLATVPAKDPYLSAEPDRVERWGRWLPKHDRCLRVGIVWQGNRFHREDRHRSIPLAALPRSPTWTHPPHQPPKGPQRRASQGASRTPFY